MRQARATQPLTIIEARRLLATCEGPAPSALRDRALIVLGLETGMTRMSLASVGLTDDGEAFPARLVPIQGTDSYLVPLSDTALHAMRPWRAWLRRRGITTGPMFRSITNRTDPKTGAAISIVGDRALTVNGIYTILQYRAQQARLPALHSNLFRRTFTAWRMEAGVAPQLIAAITGHRFPDNVQATLAQLGAEARRLTPTWLAELVGGSG